MNLKIGKVELRPWKWAIYFGCGPNNDTVSGWYREDFHNYEEVTSGSVALYTTKLTNVWHLKFWHDLDFLNDLYGQEFVTGDEDEIKQRVDKFLIRIVNLLPFI